MIADWTVEIGQDCPVIELPWPGWVDLRDEFADASALTEAQAYPELSPLLHSANHGAFATAKVDVFSVDRGEADPEIAEHPLEETACGLGSYLDVVWLPRGLPQPGFSAFESVARGVAAALGPVLLPLATAEIVVRAARLYHQETFGWTLYAVGFGPDAASARLRWASAARAVVAAMRDAVNAPPWASSSIG